MKERLINLLNMISKQLKSEPKMSRFKFVVNGFICEDTGQDIAQIQGHCRVHLQKYVLRVPGENANLNPIPWKYCDKLMV